MEPIRLQYSEDLIRRAVWAFWWRSTGYTFFGAMFIVFAGFVDFLALGERSWWLGAMGSFIVGVVLIATLLYFVHFRGSIARFLRMRSKEATLEISDDKLRMSSDIGSFELSWSSVIKVWRFPEFWLLFYSAAQFSILPLNDLDMAAKTIILERAKAHGAVIA